MKRKWRNTTRRKFGRHVAALRRMLDKHVGVGNYANASSHAQLDRIVQKFWDCTWAELGRRG